MIYIYKCLFFTEARLNAAIVLQGFFRRMLGKREAQGRIAKMVEDALKEIARLKKMNFFIVKLQRIYRGKAARNFVNLLREHRIPTLSLASIMRI